MGVGSEAKLSYVVFFYSKKIGVDHYGPSVTVTSQTTRASVLLDSSVLGTIDASVMTIRSPMDAPYTFGRPIASCMTVSSICLRLGGRLPLMRLSAAPSEEGLILISKGRAIKRSW